jgi:hypothetical protein
VEISSLASLVVRWRVAAFEQVRRADPDAVADADVPVVRQ